MNTALIICTYMRPLAVKKLLDSVQLQTKIPQQIIVVDGSTDDATKSILEAVPSIPGLDYFQVDALKRGLTKQRNFGVQQLKPFIDIICFLDDDLVIADDYFEQIEKTYQMFPDAIGIGGIDLEANRYFKKSPGVHYNKFDYYELDGWMVKEQLRYKARKLVGLMSNLRPGIIPGYSNGRVGFPPNGNIYPVEFFMGGISSYKKQLLHNIKFSTYFEGYGLYEDFDFCIRALQFGKLYVNTNARVWHYHDSAGRPNHFRYGKMVVRNGWYVWRVRFPQPSFKTRFQWNAIFLLLAFIRLSNVITGPDNKGAFPEFCGRVAGWLSIVFSRPSIEQTAKNLLLKKPVSI